MQMKQMQQSSQTNASELLDDHRQDKRLQVKQMQQSSQTNASELLDGHRHDRVELERQLHCKR